MFNEIITSDAKPLTEGIDGSIGLVGVYSISSVQGTLDSYSIDSLSTDYAVINPPSELTLDYASWVYEPLIAICDILPFQIGDINILPIDPTAIYPSVTDAIYVSDPIVDTETIATDANIDSSEVTNAYTDPSVIDPIYVIDPILDTGIVETDTSIDSPEVTNESTDSSTTDPSVTDPIYTVDPVFTDFPIETFVYTDYIDPIYVSDPMIDTDTIGTDGNIDSSVVTNEYTDSSITDSILNDSTDISYYTKDPIISDDTSTIRYLTTNNESDQSIETFVSTDPISDSDVTTDSPVVINNQTDSSIDTSTDPAITETPVYKDDSTATDVVISTDYNVNDLSDVAILNYFRPTEINYREISFQPEASLQLTDTLVINPTVEAGINLVDLSTGNSVSLTPTVTDSSTETNLNDLSLALSSITDSSIFTTAKAKK